MVSLLAENDINIRALTVSEIGETALIRFIVDNALWTASILKNAGYHAQLSDVAVVKISNVPGGLARILETLHYAEVNIEHMYSIMTNKFLFGEEHNAYVVLDVDNFAKASEAFNKAGIRIIKQGEIVGL